MSTQNTVLSASNLLIYPSVRMRKTDDGGGLMTGTPLTGAVNEMFDPTSEVERVNGGFDARLVYPAVLTTDKSKMYGAYTMVGQAPTMQNVSIIIFKGDHYGEQYDEFLPRVEAYSTPTIESNMTPLGRQLSGSKTVQAYIRTNDELPKVGERYCLYNKSTDNYEYFRIASIASRTRTFTDSSGDFQRLVVTMTTTDSLSSTFQGMDYPVRSKNTSDVQILETQISDSSQYYGIKSLSANATAGSATVTLSSVYEQLVPTSTTNTAYADEVPADNELFIPLNTSQTLHSGWLSGGNYYLPYAVVPGSVTLGGYEDDGNGNLVNGANSIAIDYENGIIYSVPSGSNTLTGTIAAKASNFAYSTYIPIDQTNQQTEWAPLFDPIPAYGSASISYLVGGTWYTIKDRGDYTLVNGDGEQVGIINSDGSCTVSLDDLPDAGSNIVVAWTPKDYYRTINDNDVGTTVSPETTEGSTVILQSNGDSRPIVPESVSVSFSDGDTTKTATDDGSGNLTGDITGVISYSEGIISSADISTNEVTCTCKRYSATKKNSNIQIVSNTDGSFSGTLGQNIVKGSVLVYLVCTGYVDSTGIRTKYNVSRSWGLTGQGGYARFGWNSTYSKSTTIYTGSGSASQLVAMIDDGNGGLMINGERITGTIDYSTGVFSGKFAPSGLLALARSDATANLNLSGAKALGVTRVNNRSVRSISYFTFDSYATAIYLDDSTEVDDTFIFETGINQFNILKTKRQPCFAVLNSWKFDANGTTLYEQNGTVYKTYSSSDGFSDSVGTLDATGYLNISDSSIDTSNLKITQGVYCYGIDKVTTISGRSPASPVVPQSITVYAVQGDETLSATADADGNFQGDFSGTVNYQTGFFTVADADGFSAEQLRLNCTTEAYLPLAQSLIGVDAVRLRPDGKTPIYREGDTVVIHNRASHDLGTAHTGGDTESVGRDDIDRIAIKDANNVDVDATLYDYDLDAGTITWVADLDLSAYTMPLTAYTSREELNRITKLDINGTLTLQNPLARDYPAEGSHVSSCLVTGTLQAIATEPFSQKTWTDVWSDQRIGDEILAKLNVNDYPITLSNDGAVTQDWMIRFDSSTQFKLYAKDLGLIGQFDVLTDLAPTNPATNKPYFTIPKDAFTASDGSSAWAAGNCIRFNTTGTNIPTWVIKTIQPTTQEQEGNDTFDICFRGDTTEN